MSGPLRRGAAELGGRGTGSDSPAGCRGLRHVTCGSPGLFCIEDEMIAPRSSDLGVRDEREGALNSSWSRG